MATKTHCAETEKTLRCCCCDALLGASHCFPTPFTCLPGSTHLPSPTDVAWGGRTTHDAVNAGRASHAMLFPIPVEQRSHKSAGMVSALSPHTNARKIYGSSTGTDAPVRQPSIPSCCQHCLFRDGEASPLVLQGIHVPTFQLDHRGCSQWPRCTGTWDPATRQPFLLQVLWEDPALPPLVTAPLCAVLQHSLFANSLCSYHTCRGCHM